MEFSAEKKQPLSYKHFSEEDKKTALNFAHSLEKELKDFLKAVILFGSCAKHERVQTESDIDVLVIIDDTQYTLNKELIESYRIITENVAASTSLRLHINTLRLTSFWDYVRNGDPVIINMLRDGIPLIDKGFFTPVQFLLHQGRIRPSKESIWTYYAKVPLTIKNSRWHIMQACLDLYWAAIDTSHAAIMKAGEIPTEPSHVPAMLERIFVKKGLLDKKYPKIMQELYELAKSILHGTKTSISGKEYDFYLKITQNFVEELKKIIISGEKI